MRSGWSARDVRELPCHAHGSHRPDHAGPVRPQPRLPGQRIAPAAGPLAPHDRAEVDREPSRGYGDTPASALRY